MSENTIPIEGNWYKSLDTGKTLSVVTFDEDESIVEIQYYNGKLEEIEIEEWDDLSLELIDQPEDYIDDAGNLDEDNMHYEMDDMDSDQWGDPLTEIED
jgi:hypothetical protein